MTGGTGTEAEAVGASASCAFCRIVAGAEPAFEVWRDDATVAFLDTRPLFPGHTLVVPRPHLVSLPDLDAVAVGTLFATVQALSVAVRDATGAQGTFVAVNNVVSQSVPHLHVHVVPRTKGDGLKGFFWPRTRYADDGHATSVAGAIAAAMESLSPPG